MDELIHIGKILYAYCTDFIINLANLFGASYYEVNAVVFCFLYPVILTVLLVVYIRKKLVLKKMLHEK